MPYWKEIISVLLAFGIGTLCGIFKLPLPAPPHWFGVILIFMIWLGYTLFSKSS